MVLSSVNRETIIKGSGIKQSGIRQQAGPGYVRAVMSLLIVWANLWIASIAFFLPLNAVGQTAAPVLQAPRLFRWKQQPLASAFIAFSQQSGIQLIIASPIDPQWRAPAIDGHFKPADVLQRLLSAGAGLYVESGGDYTLIIRQRQPDTGKKQSNTIEEILVTARKREQRPEALSIALTVFDRRDIEVLGLSRPQALVAQSPSVTVKSPYATNNPVFTIRGVGYNNFSSNTNSSIGFYVDDFYLNSSSLLSFDLFDIERIEVLRGPQGTLFGRNTVGGAIAVVTRRPEQDFEAYLNTDIGNYQYLSLKGAIGGGLSEVLSARFAFSYRQQQRGFYTNNLNGNNHGELDSYSWRASALWSPDTSLEVNGQLYSFRDRSEQWHYQVFVTQSAELSTEHPLLGTVFDQPCQAWLQDNFEQLKQTCVNFKGYRDDDGDAYSGLFSLDPITRVDNDGAIVQIKRTLGATELQSITGYQQFKRFLQEEFDGSPFLMGDNELTDDIQNFSQELRFVSIDDSALSWILGGIYSSESIDASVLTSGKDRWGTDLLIDYQQTTTNQAVFTHLEWSVSPKWKVLAGLRYSHDRIRFDGTTQNTDPFNNGVVTVLGVSIAPGIVAETDSSISYGAWSGKLGVDYPLSEDQLWYAHISRAYKSGGYTGYWTILPEDGAPYNEETLTAYESGFKWQLPHYGLAASTALYYYDYQNLQQNVPTVAGTFLVSNVGDIISKGLEGELHWRPVAALKVTAGASYIDAGYRRGSSNGTRGLSGNVPVNTPEWAMNTAFEYTYVLNEGMALMIAADAAYQSKVYLSVENRETESQQAYWLYNGRVVLLGVEQGWELALWGKNLADKEYVIEAFSSLSSGSLMRAVGAPKTYGLSVNFAW